MPVRHEVETVAPYVLSAVVVEANTLSGKALSIETIYLVDDQELAL